MGKISLKSLAEKRGWNPGKTGKEYEARAKALKGNSIAQTEGKGEGTVSERKMGIAVTLLDVPGFRGHIEDIKEKQMLKH
jgi:hypothetical protein